MIVQDKKGKMKKKYYEKRKKEKKKIYDEKKRKEKRKRKKKEQIPPPYYTLYNKDRLLNIQIPLLPLAFNHYSKNSTLHTHYKIYIYI